MAAPKTRRANEMECGICGLRHWTRTAAHWWICGDPECLDTVRRYTSEDAEDSHADGHNTRHYNSVEDNS